MQIPLDGLVEVIPRESQRGRTQQSVAEARPGEVFDQRIVVVVGAVVVVVVVVCGTRPLRKVRRHQRVPGTSGVELAQEHQTAVAQVHEAVRRRQVEVDALVEFSQPLPAAVERVAFLHGRPAVEHGADRDVRVGRGAQGCAGGRMVDLVEEGAREVPQAPFEVRVAGDRGGGLGDRLFLVGLVDAGARACRCWGGREG